VVAAAGDVLTPYPKPEKPKLFKGPGYTAFRIAVHDAYRGRCADCGRAAPLMDNGEFDPFSCGHVAHTIRRKKGGDVMSNVKWKCYECHIIKEHGPQWGKREG